MASAIPYYDKLNERIVKQLTPYCDVIGGPNGPDYWARTAISMGLGGFVAFFLIVWFFTGNLLYAFITGPVAAFFIGYAVTTFPQAQAHSKVEAIERALPMFVSHLISTYADRRNMRDALIQSSRIEYGPLTPELVHALRIYEATSDVNMAFWRLKNFKNRYVTRTFELISYAMESGVDIAETLNMLTSDIQQNIEAKDDKNSRTGLSVWMVFASSALFYPLFVGVGLSIMTILEKVILSKPLYSDTEKGLMMFSLICYMLIAVVLDSAFIGQVQYNSVRKGMVRFLPLIFGVACIVLLLSMWALNMFLIG